MVGNGTTTSPGQWLKKARPRQAIFSLTDVRVYINLINKKTASGHYRRKSWHGLYCCMKNFLVQMWQQ
jgi:hypothetical protein